jgi:hypothetical protein
MNLNKNQFHEIFKPNSLGCIAFDNAMHSFLVLDNVIHLLLNCTNYGTTHTVGVIIICPINIQKTIHCMAPCMLLIFFTHVKGAIDVAYQWAKLRFHQDWTYIMQDYF